MKKIIWIVIETPIKSEAGEFFVYGPYTTLEEAEGLIHQKAYVYDYIPLDVTNLKIEEI